MKIVIAAPLLTLTVFSSLSLAADVSGRQVDPKAAEIAQKAADFLAVQPAFSFTWFVSYDDVVDGREKITYLRSGDTVMVRDKGFVSHTERENTLRDYYYDGSVFTVASPNENFYTSIPFHGGFDALVKAVRERSGTVLPLWSMMSETLPKEFLSTVESGADLGTTLVAGQQAYHLAFSENSEDWQVWISTDEDSPLPLMLVGTDKTKQGWPQYRVYMTDWNLSPDQDPAQFTFTPGKDDVRVTFPVSEAESGSAQGPQAENPAAPEDGKGEMPAANGNAPPPSDGSE